MGTHDISLEPGAPEEGAHPMPYKAEGGSSDLCVQPRWQEPGEWT